MRWGRRGGLTCASKPLVTSSRASPFPMLGDRQASPCRKVSSKGDDRESGHCLSDNPHTGHQAGEQISLLHCLSSSHRPCTNRRPPSLPETYDNTAFAPTRKKREAA